ncbi:MAG TPA: fibronectin type III domain-containing protein, partial [Solirubrobacterales bacterium]
MRQYGPVNDPGLTAAPAAADAIHAPTEFGTRAMQGLGLNAAAGTLYVGSEAGVILPAACEGKCYGLYALDDDGTDATVDAQVAAPLDVTATGAELSGTVDPGRGVARYRFEISADGSVWTPLAESRVEGTGPQAVSATATGLDPNSDYRARLFTRKILSPAAFVSDTSSEAIFLTDAAPPAAITSPVGPRTDTGAELRASVDPNGTATTYWFEYGPTAGYGTAVPVPAAPAGSGNEALALAQQVSGLLPGTTYHYRVVADGFGPPVFGADQAFTTLPAPQPQPQLGDRDYELVSPADKLSGVGVGQWYSGRGSFIEDAGVAAYDAERFAAQGRFGANLLNGAHGYANDWAFAERVNGDVGWRSHSPITHPSSAISFASFLDMQSTSENLSSVFWGANNTLALFPELAASEWTSIAPGALSDWGGASSTRWELMGPRSIAEVSDLHQADKQLWDVNFSADGTKAVGTTALIYPARLARVVGLSGPGDPTNPAWGAPAGDLVSGRSVYVADLAGGLADSFAGTGQRPLANVCTGAAGADRTVLPGVDGTGKLAATECPAPLPGRDARLLSDRGATAVATRSSALVIAG